MWIAKLLVILLAVFTATAGTESEASDYTYEDNQDRTTTSLDSEYTRDFDKDSPEQIVTTEQSLRYIHVRRDENSEDTTQTRIPLVFLNASFFKTTTQDSIADTSTIMEMKTTEPTTEFQHPLEVIPHTSQNSLDVDLMSLYAKVTNVQNKASIPPDQLKKDSPYQRGVLDLLIPKTRLQTFKGYLNAFMHFLSGAL